MALSREELASLFEGDMREFDESTLTDTCTIYRPPDPATAERTASGSVKDKYPDNWQTVATGVPCLIKAPNRASTEGPGAGKVQSTELPSGKFKYNQVIDETCRVRITDSMLSPLLIGEDYDVIKAPLGGQMTTRVVELSKTTR